MTGIVLWTTLWILCINPVRRPSEQLREPVRSPTAPTPDWLAGVRPAQAVDDRDALRSPGRVDGLPTLRVRGSRDRHLLRPFRSAPSGSTGRYLALGQQRPNLAVTGESASTRTTVVGGSIDAASQRQHLDSPGAAPLQGRPRAAATSSEQTHPSSPAGLRPGAPAASTSPAAGASGATARDVTTVNSAPSVQLLGPRPDHLDVVQAELGRPPRRGSVVRRSSGSTSVTRRSGRRMASTRPGRPAPEPRSHTSAPAREQRRPAPRSSAGAGPTAAAPRAARSARGPPRRSASRAAYALGEVEPSSEHPPRRAPARGVFHVEQRASRGVRHAVRTSRGQHHDVAPRLLALGLRGQAGRRDRVVHDLALERASSGPATLRSPEARTSATASSATRSSRERLSARKPPMSSISRDRSPVSR